MQDTVDQLILSVYKGDLKAVSTVRDKNILNGVCSPVDVKVRWGRWPDRAWTPLGVAVHMAHYEVTVELLKNGAVFDEETLAAVRDGKECTETEDCRSHDRCPGRRKIYDHVFPHGEASSNVNSAMAPAVAAVADSTTASLNTSPTMSVDS